MKPHRRWCQYSLRWLLLFILLASVAMGQLSRVLRRAELREKAIASIIAAGGRMGYDYDSPRSFRFDPSGRNEYPEPPGPAWLRRLLGNHFFTEVRLVDFTFTEGTDMRLESLKDLPEVPWVALWGSEVTDDGLRHLKGVTQLRRLSMDYTDITDAGLEHLEELTQLRYLDIRNTKVTDVGLKHLHGLRDLEELCLSGHRITDRGIESLKDMTHLKVLGLSETGTTDAGLEYVKGLCQLRELWLDGTKVTPGGLKRIRRALPDCTLRY